MSCLKTAHMKWHQILLTPFYSTETFSDFKQLFTKTEQRLNKETVSLLVGSNSRARCLNKHWPQKDSIFY